MHLHTLHPPLSVFMLKRLLPRQSFSQSVVIKILWEADNIRLQSEATLSCHTPWFQQFDFGLSSPTRTTFLAIVGYGDVVAFGDSSDTIGLAAHI